MVGDVAVYLLAGLGAERVVVAGHEMVFIHKGDVPEGHIADDVMLHGCGLVLVDAWDAGRKGLVGSLTEAHHSPREIYVFEIVLHSFLRYYATGYRNAGSPIEFESAINKHDDNLYNISRLPTTIHYHPYYFSEVKPLALRRAAIYSQMYGYLVDGSGNVLQKYPNQSLPSLRIYNAYERADSDPMTSQITSGFEGNYTWQHANFYRWGDQEAGLPNNYCKYFSKITR